MTQTKKYAIRCSSEEEARECKENWYSKLYSKSWDLIYFIREIQSRPVISYKKAVEMGLLGRKKTNDDINYMQSEVTPIVPSQITTSPCPNCWVVYQMWDDNKFHIIKWPNNYKLIEKIMEDINQPICMTPGSTRSKELRKILTKHLSSK